MAATKPTLVLISGAWHVPSTYSKLTDTLNVAGYEVHVPRLPSVNGTRPPNADLTTDTALIREYVENIINSGQTVIAIMHSYGGQVGTNALYGLGLDSCSQKGMTGGVSHLIYMCRWALPEGGSIMAKVREFGSEDLLHQKIFHFAEDGTCVNRNPKLFLIGRGVEDAEADSYLASLVRWNGNAMFQELTNCAWREIPVTYIGTSQDMSVPVKYQKAMLERMRAEGREIHVVELDTGHCPNLTVTGNVVDVINDVATKMNKNKSEVSIKVSHNSSL
jgi:pimeloyl-ACP methyl ester carboxylesterase